MIVHKVSIYKGFGLWLGTLFVFNRVEIHLLKIPSGTIWVLFESILVPEIYKNPSKTYCFRGIQLNINKKRNDPTFTVHPAFKAPGGHFLFILYTIVRKICQTSLRWSKLIVGWKTLEITLGMFSESDLLL